MPGSPTTAVLIGALIIHGLQPGPKLFVDHVDIVYTLFVGLSVSYVVLYLLGRLGMRLWVKIVSIPQTVLAPIIFGLSAVGAYSIRSLTFDIWLALGFGLLGYILKKARFPLAPLILAMIIGPMVESNYNRALLLAQNDGHLIFLQSPLSVALLLLSVVAFFYPIIRAHREKKKAL